MGSGWSEILPRRSRSKTIRRTLSQPGLIDEVPQPSNMQYEQRMLRDLVGEPVVPGDHFGFEPNGERQVRRVVHGDACGEREGVQDGESASQIVTTAPS